MRHLLSDYLAYYHGERPHQSLGNRPLTASPLPEPVERVAREDIVCTERLGGLLKHYTRRAG